MKKLLAAVMSASILLGMAACSSKSNETVVEDEPSKKSDGVMSYADFMDAEIDSEVTIEAYVQAKQSWWEDKASLYTQDLDGAYFVYDGDCTKELYEELVPGQKVKITGYKSEWSGEIEIVDATIEKLKGNYIAEPVDVTDKLNLDELIDYQNQFVSFHDMKVKSAAIYKWDGSGSDGDDLYFTVSKDGQSYQFTVESYLCDNSTDVYKTVLGLKVGDVVDMEGFLYWYKGANPHITSVRVK